MAEISDDEFARRMRKAREARGNGESLEDTLAKIAREEEAMRTSMIAIQEERAKAFEKSRPFEPPRTTTHIIPHDEVRVVSEEPIEPGDYGCLWAYNFIQIKKAFVDPFSDKYALRCSRDVMDTISDEIAAWHATTTEKRTLRLRQSEGSWPSIWLEGVERPRPFAQLAHSLPQGADKDFDIVLPPISNHAAFRSSPDWVPFVYAPKLHREIGGHPADPRDTSWAPLNGVMNVIDSIRSGEAGDGVFVVNKTAVWTIEAIELIGLRNEVIASVDGKFRTREQNGEPTFKDRMWEITRKRFSQPSRCLAAKIEVSSASHRLKVGLHLALL